MPLDLHPSLKERLVELVTEALPTIQVERGMFPVRHSGFLALTDAEKALPQTGKLRERLLAYIDDRPLTEFILDTLTDELRDAEYISEPPSQSLASLGSYSDVVGVAKRLVHEFDALPNEYAVTARLPSDLSPMLARSEWKRDFGQKLRLVRGSPELAEQFSLNTENSKLGDRLKGGTLLSLGGPPAEWQTNDLYLQIRADGFIGGYGGSVPDLEARRDIRSFFGLGIALQLFDTNFKYSPYTTRVPYFVHRKHTNGTWQVRDRLELGDGLSRALDDLSLNKLNGRVVTLEDQESFAAGVFTEMDSVYAGGKSSETILLSSQWYFDSSTGSEELLRFIQAMIVIEILLGDKPTSDETGLNALLRNRCAYLIGSSQQDRAEVLKLFDDIYTVRSQIVHRGKHRLNIGERILFANLRWLCRRVIQKEVDLLKADKR